MKYTINEKLKRLAPYEPISGEYRIRLDANESFLAIGDETIAKISEEITAASLNRYPDPYAAEVCGLFADYCGISAGKLVAGNGSDEIISIIISSFFSKGDKIATFKPDFSMYGFYAHLSELENVAVEKDENLRIDVDAVCGIINAQNIKGVIFSNPCSPTGIGLPASDALRLAEKTCALVIVDEAYMEFYNESVMDKLDELHNLIVLKTCSKAFGLAGIRLGFACSNEGIINAIKAAKSPYNVNTLTQCAAKAVLSDKQKIKKGIDKIIQARDFLYAGLKEREGGIVRRVFPTDTNFVFFEAEDGAYIYNRMKQDGIAVRVMGDYLRVTAGSEEENAEFLKSLDRIGGYDENGGNQTENK